MLIKNVREKERESLDEKIVINKMQVVWLVINLDQKQ